MQKFLAKILIILSVFIGINTYAQTVQRDTVLSTDICFYVNTNNIIKNDEGFKKYTEEILPYIYANISSLDKIVFRGAASIEGTLSLNYNLSKIRIEKILDNSWYLPSNKIEKDYRGEDYDRLIELLPTEEQRNTVTEIIKSGVDIKKKIRSLPFYTDIAKNIYSKLRSVRVDAYFKFEEPLSNVDTLYIERVDTVYQRDTTYQRDTVYQRDTIYQRDTVYLNKKNEDKLVFSIYNSLIEDLLIRPNIGLEFYFHQMSWFIDGSFSSGTFYGKKYDIDFWHTGLRKYFNNRYDKLYIELYGRIGWYDTDLFSKDDNGVFGVFFGCGLGIGYKFSVCKHWKITPNIRFGFDNFKFNDYYYTDGNGSIDVSFGKYVDGRNPSNESNPNVQTSINKNGNIVYINDKTINRYFFNNSYNMYWFGPTYIGITIQRDFYIHK